MPTLSITRSSKSLRRLVLPAVLTLAVVILAAVAFLAWRWPFSRALVVKDLEEASLSKVQVGGFRETYFPRPGCVLENVTFQHNPKPGSPPLITVQRLRIESSFSGLFTRHVMRIRADGLHLLVPPRGSGEHFQVFKRSAFVIDELVADGAVLEVASREPQEKPLQFSFHNFALTNVGASGPASFQARFSNPEPPGEITTTGKFGPWNPDDVGKVAVSGDYQFQQAELGTFHGIAGTLASTGKFSGTLKRIEIQGKTDVPYFKVASSSHEVQLQTQFHGIVDGENGDTLLPQVVARFWKTTIESQGSVKGTTDRPGKTASIELAAQNGRIQDLLLLFARSQRSPMYGTVSFHAKVSIPPGERPFLEKVELLGDFGIDAGSFSKPSTQQGVNHLSHGAQGDEKSKTAEKDNSKKEEDKNEEQKKHESKDDDTVDAAATVLSDLKGHVLLKGGTARFSNLSFSVPGAVAQMQGTYNLITEKVDLHGTLKTDSAPSNTTQGVKSVLMKVLDPFFKKKAVGYAMPIKITGTYEHPSFGLDLGGKNDKSAREQKTRATRLLNGGNH